MDKRQKRTKKIIMTTFIDLINSKSIDEISIQEIVEKAEIGRSTFYSHFKTKNELLTEICNDMFEHIFSKEAVCSKINCDFEIETLAHNNSIENKISHILYHLQENKVLMCSIIIHNSWEIFKKSFKQYLVSIFRQRIRIYNNSNNVSNEYLLNHFCCSLIETIQWWFSQYSHLSAKEVAELFLSVISSVIKNIH